MRVLGSACLYLRPRHLDVSNVADTSVVCLPRFAGVVSAFREQGLPLPGGRQLPERSPGQ